MKNSFYFSHDYNTRTNPKIKRLIMKHGYEGYGIFWALIEDLYNNANALRLDYDCIAFDLRTEKEIVKDIIEGFGLFEIKDGIITSNGVAERLEKRNEKSQKAKESAFRRWDKQKDANAMRTQCESNAIKERKEKESKVKERKIKENKEKEKNIGELPLAFGSDRFKNVWSEFLAYRKSKKKPVSYLAAQKIMQKLRQKPEQTAILMLETSMQNDWTGIFDVKETAKKEPSISLNFQTAHYAADGCLK